MQYSRRKISHEAGLDHARGSPAGSRDARRLARDVSIVPGSIRITRKLVMTASTRSNGIHATSASSIVGSTRTSTRSPQPHHRIRARCHRLPAMPKSHFARSCASVPNSSSSPSVMPGQRTVTLKLMDGPSCQRSSLRRGGVLGAGRRGCYGTSRVSSVAADSSPTSDESRTIAAVVTPSIVTASGAR